MKNNRLGEVDIQYNNTVQIYTNKTRISDIKHYLT